VTAGRSGSPRALPLLGSASAILYLVFYYVPISARHTVEAYPWRPLGSWTIDSGSPLAFFYLLLLAALFGLYAAALVRTARHRGEEEGSRRVVLACAALMIAILLFVPSLLSKDVFDYMVQGRLLAVHHLNPFQVTADSLPADEFVRAMGWPQYTSLYGPGWVSTSGLIARISPSGLPGALLVYKVLFGVVHLLNGLLIGVLLRGWGRRPLWGQIAYLWNPLVVLQVAGGAHNDAFLMLWVLLGLLFVQRSSAGSGLSDEALGAICLSVSVLTKYVTAPVLALCLAARAREMGGAAGLKRAIFLAGLAAAVFVAGYLPYAGGMNAAMLLRPYEHGHYQGGALMILDMALKKIAGTGETHAWVGAAMKGTGLALTLILAAWSALLLWRTRRLEQVPGNALRILLGYLLVVAPLLRVSYGVWIVALAALVRPGPLRRAALLFSASLMALEVYWVYAVRMLGEGVTIHREQAAATLVALGVPISYLLAVRIRRSFQSARA
jgi:hypothetical protein